MAGRAVYSHLIHPLVERFGESILSRGVAQVRFAKPAYEGDTISVVAEPVPGGRQRDVVLRAKNQDGVEIARLDASLPEPYPAPNPLAKIEPPPHPAARVSRRWEELELGKPWPAYCWRPTRQDNGDWCEKIGERLPLFLQGAAPPLHPGLVPTATTAMLTEQVAVEGRVHAASVFITHRLVRTGQQLELRPTLLDRFECHGRLCASVYVGMLAEGVLAVEEYRTVIFNLGTKR